MTKQMDLYDTFPINLKINKNQKETILSDSDGVKDGYSLVCEVDATHSGTIINNRIYPPDSMKKGIKSWTKPYKKPVLVNHDDTTDPIGRVIRARYESTPRGFDADYKPILKRSDGYGYQRLTVRVTDPTAIQKIIDGRYETVSVRMTTDHAWCSVCNADWSNEGPCEHMPGQKYEGKLAYMTTGDLSYREVSFVNIPADEFAGVKESLLVQNSDEEDPINISLYANNAEENVLVPLGVSDSENLYNLLDSDIEESDDIVLHLLDKSSKEQKDHKEEDVKLEELTKDQLKEIKLVQDIIKEETAKIVEDTKKSEQAACDLRLDEAKKDAVSKEDYDKVVDELEKLKTTKDNKDEKEEVAKEAPATEDSKDEPKDTIESETKEEVKDEVATEAKEKMADEAKEEPVVEAKDDSKEEAAETQAIPDEKKEEGLNDEISKLKDDKKRLLDDNVKINAELHKMVAERLYDLKKALNKPDVANIKTPDVRDKKVEELAQRSVNSLKDQISDLLIEQGTNTTRSFDGDVSSPGIAPADKTNEVEFDAKAKKRDESKKDTLNRLFSKSE